MIARVLSTALVGVEARPVFVEVHILGGGLPEFNIVGLPSAAVREARQRVRSAIINSNEGWPNKKITANLAPGDLRKDGSLLDLPIAIGVLMAEGRVKPERAASCLFLGELSLDGRLRRVKGALAAAVGAREMGVEAVVVPEDNFEEA